ncbi:MAG TPA: hypothetical protein PLZ57_02740 [Pseudobdellovibrionaceae bacterium]|nr:hypothetical protein [Pseudobdellovibrionaceae bacterium]
MMSIRQIWKSQIWKNPIWNRLYRLIHAPSVSPKRTPRATFIEVPWVAQNYSRAARLIWHSERRAWTLLDVWILARAYVPDVRVEVSEEQLDPELHALNCGQIRIARRRPLQIAEDLQFPDLAHSIEEVHLRGVEDLQAEATSANPSAAATNFAGTEASATAVLALRDETCLWLIFDSRVEPFRRDHAERVARGVLRQAEQRLDRQALSDKKAASAFSSPSSIAESDSASRAEP